MIITSMINRKGGCGKTTSTLMLAQIFSEIYEQRVLVVDLDSQANSSIYLGQKDFTGFIDAMINQETIVCPFEHTIFDVLIDPAFDIHRAIFNAEAFDKIDFIPAFANLATGEELIRSNAVIQQQFLLKNQLEKIKDEYDYCFLDCGPSLSIININALAASDYYLVPINSDFYSLDGWNQVRDVADQVRGYNPKLELLGCFMTIHSKNYGVDQYIRNAMKNVFPQDFIDIQIRRGTQANEFTLAHEKMISGKRFKSGKEQEYGICNDYIRLGEHIWRKMQ